MIKLLVCDVDGTLLKYGEKRISDNIINLLSQIYNKNIQIAIASGRSYPDLKNLFSEIQDKPYYICHDGALCIKQDKILYRKGICLSDIMNFIKTYANKYECIALYGKNFCYTIGNTKSAEHENSVEIKNYYSIKEQIYKIAVYDDKNTNIQELKPMPSGLRICSHSAGCLEYVSGFANKGAALADLQNRLFLTKFDTAAIGNDVNDIKMLKNAKYSAALSPYGSETAKFAEYNIENAEEFLNTILKSL